MFYGFKYHYCVWFFVLQDLVHKNFGHDMNETVATVQNILHHKSWCSVDQQVKGITDQEIFFDETYGKFKDIICLSSKIDSNNIDVITSTMYVALGCKCGETIIDTLNSFLMWINFENPDNPSIVSGLMQLNKTVLKTISIMFDFIDIAPNVSSIEPGILKIVVLLNLELNYAIEKFEEENISSLPLTKFTSTIYQIINLLERYTISYCTSNSNKPNPIAYTNFEIDKFPKEYIFKEKTQHFIIYFENLLDNTGLSISNFNKYNITKNTSNEKSSDEDDFNFNIIIHVLNHLNSLLCTEKSYSQESEINIDIFFFYQNSMFQLLMLILHSNIEAYLLELKQPETNPFLNKSNIQDNKLIQFYNELKLKSTAKNFPTHFVNQIDLILGILITIQDSDEIHGIDVLIENVQKEKEYLFFHLKTNAKIFQKIVDHNNYLTKKEFLLHEFLENIVSIKHIEYFNQIFNLLRNDKIEPKKDVHDVLNEIRNVVADKSIEKYICQPLYSVYAYSFDLLSLINLNLKTRFRKLKHRFESILSILMAVKFVVHELKINPNLCYNVIYAEQYLRYNLIKYPNKSLHVLEKAKRIIYLLTNFIDMHQILNCSLHTYRDSFFYRFNEGKLKTDLFMDVNKNFLKNYILKAQKSIKDLKRNTKENMKHFVLFDSLVNKISFKETQINLYWDGKLKSIHDIKGYMNKNLFYFSSITKYINVLFEWVTALLSYNVLNIINCINIEDSDFRSKQLGYNKVFNYKYVFIQFFRNGSTTLDVVFNNLRILFITNREYNKHYMEALKLILENYVKQYSIKFRVNKILKGSRELASIRKNAINEFNEVYKILEHMKQFHLNDSCLTKIFPHPLIFVFADYINIYRTINK